MPDTKLPADELAQLKQDLEGKQNATSELAKEVDRLKAQIADLTKTVGDIDQKTSAYEKAVAATDDQVKVLTDYVKTEKGMLKCALPATAVTDVEEKKADALTSLADLKTKLTDAIKKATEADKAYGTAKDATAAAQAAYKTIAELPGANTEIVKDVTTLRVAADKQGAVNSFGRQYFLVLVMEDRLGAINALTPEEYNKQLNDAGTAVSQASAAQIHRQGRARRRGCVAKTSAEGPRRRPCEMAAGDARFDPSEGSEGSGASGASEGSEDSEDS